MMKQSAHANIPIFIPHRGCPNQCVFCNQRTISGVSDFDVSTVRGQIEDALATVKPDTEVEIAFFGGSFTGIDRDEMLLLLSIAKEFIDSGRVSSVRCSTRPDYITPEILDILWAYGVRTVELGLQSFSDAVLDASKRGHTQADELNACRMIVERGFNLVGQMMIGLPKSTLADEIRTAELIASVGAAAARIYPTVVFHGTELCSMAMNGSYTPLTLDDAVERSAAVYEIFLEAGVRVIRVGLCSSESLTDASKYYSGPNHSALGELVENRLYYNRIRRGILSLDNGECRVYKVYVPRGAMSKAIGQRRINKERLTCELSLDGLVFIEDDGLRDFETRIEQERK